MRGKLTVVVILIGGALIYWYSFWFMNSLSPADLRFNMTRKTLPDSVQLEMLIPPVIEEHKIVGQPTLQDKSTKGYSAQYAKADGKIVQFNVLQFGSKDQSKAWLDTVPTGCKETAHREARVPYLYLDCGEQSHRFRWINAVYSFEVDALDIEQLVLFVNNYPF